MKILLLTDDAVVHRVAEQADECLAANAELADDIEAAGSALRHLVDLVPATKTNLFSGNLFPLLEAQYEYEAATMFARQGYYKHSMMATRNLLELGLLSVYWDAEDQSHVDIQDWLHSLRETQTPGLGEVIKRLRVIANVATFNNEAPQFFPDLKELWWALGAYVHTRGSAASSRAFGNSNINTFDASALMAWQEKLRSVVQIVVALHLLKYPVGLQVTDIGTKFGLNTPMGGLLEPWKRDRLVAFLPKDVHALLQKISDADENALDIAHWVSEMPDLSPTEIVEQLEAHDRSWIEMSGFDNWEESRVSTDGALADHLTDQESQERRAYRERMRIWAEANGFMTRSRPSEPSDS